MVAKTNGLSRPFCPRPFIVLAFALAGFAALAQNPALNLRFEGVGDRLFVGADSLISLSISNAGPAATGVLVSNTLTAGTVLRSATPAPVSSANDTFVFQFGPLAAQSNVTIQLVVTTFDPQHVCASASASANGTNVLSGVWCGPEFRSLTCFPQLSEALCRLNGDGTSASFDTAHADPRQFQGAVEYAPGVSGRAFKFNGTDATLGLEVRLRPPQSRVERHALPRGGDGSAGGVSMVLQRRAAAGRN